MKIKEYKIIEEYHLSALSEKVNSSINDWYQPYKWIVIKEINSSLSYLQVVVKYDTGEDDLTQSTDNPLSELIISDTIE